MPKSITKNVSFLALIVAASTAITLAATVPHNFMPSPFHLGHKQANLKPRRFNLEAVAEWAALSIVVLLLIASGFQS